MAHIEKHAPGSFCWVELCTSDQPAAKAFYTALLDWESVDAPMGPDAYYTTFTLQTRKAAACYTLRADELKQGIPPHWNLYVSVDSADAATRKASECNGTVFCGPFDVATHGRTSTIADPTGAVFCIWEAKNHPGIGVQGEASSFCWADLRRPIRRGPPCFIRSCLGGRYGKAMGIYLRTLLMARKITTLEACRRRAGAIRISLRTG